jgi:hypothetical protein
MMAHPTDPDAAFAMLCYKNGGVARQAIRDQRCGAMWPAFDAALRSTPPGNGGVLGLYLPLPEITPVVSTTGFWCAEQRSKRAKPALNGRLEQSEMEQSAGSNGVQRLA